MARLPLGYYRRGGTGQERVIRYPINYVGSFLFAKLSVLIAPFLLFEIASHEEFSAIEFSISVATAICALLSCAAGSTIPYMILRRGIESFARVVWAYASLITLTGAVLCVAAYLLSSLSLQLTVAMCTISTVATLGSAFFKTTHHPSIAVFLESVLYVILLCFAIHAALAGDRIKLNMLSAILFIPAIAIMAMVWSRAKQWKLSITRSTRQARVALAFMGPVALSSTLSVVLMQSGRYISATADTPDVLAVFSIFLRVAFTALVIQQFVLVFGFREMYQRTANDFDVFVLKIFLAILGFHLLVFMTAVTPLTDLLLPNLASAIESYLPEFLCLLLASLIVSQCGFLSLVVHREKLTRGYLPFQALVLGSIFVTQAIIGTLSVKTVTMIYLAALYADYFSLNFLLKRSKYNLKLSRNATLATLPLVIGISVL